MVSLCNVIDWLKLKKITYDNWSWKESTIRFAYWSTTKSTVNRTALRITVSLTLMWFYESRMEWYKKLSYNLFWITRGIWTTWLTWSANFSKNLTDFQWKQLKNRLLLRRSTCFHLCEQISPEYFKACLVEFGKIIHEITFTCLLSSSCETMSFTQRCFLSTPKWRLK